MKYSSVSSLLYHIDQLFYCKQYVETIANHRSGLLIPNDAFRTSYMQSLQRGDYMGNSRGEGILTAVSTRRRERPQWNLTMCGDTTAAQPE